MVEVKEVQEGGTHVIHVGVKGADQSRLLGTLHKPGHGHIDIHNVREDDARGRRGW